MTWTDGASYRGNWNKNIARGQGKFIFSDGDTYVGEWNYYKSRIKSI